MKKLLAATIMVFFITLAHSSYGQSNHYADSVRKHIDSLIAKCEEAPEDTGKAKKLLEVANYLYNIHRDDSSLMYYKNALDVSLRHKFNGGAALAYEMIGEIYMLRKANSQLALNNLLQALDIAEKNGKKSTVAGVYGDLSGLYRQYMKNYPKAIDYAQKALQIQKELNIQISVATSLVSIGNIYYDLDSTAKALTYFTRALRIVDSINKPEHLNMQADIENNIGSGYTDLKKYDSAISYYNRALVIYDRKKDTDGMAMTYGNIGNVKNMQGNPEEGVKDAEASLQLARKMKNKDNDVIAAAYSFLAEGYSDLGDYKKAYEYQTALVNFKDTVFSQNSSKQINEMQVKYDTDKKEKENQILELNNKKQKIISYAITVGLLLVIGLAFFIYRGYRDKHKANEALAEKNKIIEEKNKDILDSINYAKRIQQALLTSNEYMKEAMGEHFVLYKPRDVVSGDFYWCHNNRDKVIFAVADCTGHGVPGAFMSMIGISLLNEIIVENKITDAADILDSLRGTLLKTLQQKSQNTITRDGMDIALCVWDKAKDEIQYAGANNSMYLSRKRGSDVMAEGTKLKIHNEHLYEVLPDKQPIGFMEEKMDKPFTSFKIKVEKGDVIYIGSDGYQDQFGGESNKKFTKKKYRELLASFNGSPLQGQREHLDTTLENWKNHNLQTDDICVVGVRIS